MQPDERSKLHKEQSDDIYRAIGMFTVKFEQIVFYMRLGVGFFLARGGLKNQELSNIVLADLTAYPMKSIFGSMIPKMANLNDYEKRIVKDILKRIQSLIDKRNDVIHSMWFVGAASPQDTDFSEVSGHKMKKRKIRGWHQRLPVYK